MKSKSESSLDLSKTITQNDTIMQCTLFCLEYRQISRGLIFVIIITVTWQEKGRGSGSCDLCLCTQLLAQTQHQNLEDHHYLSTSKK